MIRVKKELFQYIKGLTIVSAVIAALAFILFKTILMTSYHPVFWILLGFFFLIHIAGHSVVVFNEKSKRMSFANAYMLSFAIKFFGYIIFLVTYFFLNRNNIMFFSISLLALYVLFTFYEVKSSVSFSKRTVNKENSK